MTPELCTTAYRAPELHASCTKYGAAVDMWSTGLIFAEILGCKQSLFKSNFRSYSQLQFIISSLHSKNRSKIVSGSAALSWVNLPTPQLTNECFCPFCTQETKTKPLMSTNRETIQKLLTSHGYKGKDSAAVDLLSRLLTIDPSSRLTAKDALNHSYFTQQVRFATSGNAPLGVSGIQEGKATTARHSQRQRPVFCVKLLRNQNASSRHSIRFVLRRRAKDSLQKSSISKIRFVRTGSVSITMPMVRV